MGRSLVSLDLGSSGVRAVQHSTGKDVSAQTLAFAPLPAGAIVGGELRDPAALTAALKDLWRTHKFKTKQVAFSVGNQNVITRTLPGQEWLPEKEFRQSLRYVVGDFLTSSVDDFTFDYHVVAETDEPGAREDQTRRVRKVIVVAAPRDTVNQFVEAIRGAGLLPVRADLTPFSLIRACLNPQSTEPEAVVDIGAELTTVIVHRGGQPEFVRIIPGHGGNSINNALKKKFLWSDEDAETTKRMLGLSTKVVFAPAAAEPSVFSTGDEPTTGFAEEEHPAQEVINQFANVTIAEIRTSLDFYLSGAPRGEAIFRVTLSGGGSLLKHLPQRLASELRTTVEYATALQRVGAKAGAPEGTVEPQWTVVAGTALGENR